MTKYFTKEGDDFKEVTDPLHTQSDVDEVVKTRLERERGKFADYDTLKEKAGKVDSLNEEWQTKQKGWETEKSDLEKQLGGAKLETEKVKIVNQFKLSDDLAEFVTGDTVDDMRAKAEKLAKGVKPTGVNIDKKPKPDGDGKPADSKALAGKLFGKNKSDD
jgi:hypothetical protein